MFWLLSDITKSGRSLQPVITDGLSKPEMSAYTCKLFLTLDMYIARCFSTELCLHVNRPSSRDVLQEDTIRCNV